MKKKVLWSVLGVVVVAIVVLGFLVWWNFLAHRVSVPPAVSTTTGGTTPSIVSLATGLEIPWELAFLPDGGIILTERPGRIRLVDSREGLLEEPLLAVPDVVASGEGGLLGITLHPDFTDNGYVYVYHTYNGAGGPANRVVRFVMRGRSLTGGQVIFDGIPASSIHDGGRVKFGPDGLLYITAGDASNPDSAQDLDYLGGKILRLRDDGSIPEDNPFPGSPVYTYGHRNPEGLAWDDQGRLWETEHGSSATDELNLIVPGKNYGWPVIRGDQTAAGMETPVINSGGDTWAPSGTAYYQGSILFAGLRGQSLYEVDISGPDYTLSRYLRGEFGRLRNVVVGPDGYLYLLTSNRDGRGIPTPQDDQLFRMKPPAAAPR